MQETDRIIKLFEDLYDGSPWIDVTLIGTLENVTAEQASWRVLPNRNTIWEIVNHLISWRLNVLQRVQGKVLITPDNNYIAVIEDVSPAAWADTLQQLKGSQQQWVDFLKTFREDDFEKIYPNNSMTYYEHIHGIIQHDAYHLGQIVILAKSVT